MHPLAALSTQFDQRMAAVRYKLIRAAEILRVMRHIILFTKPRELKHVSSSNITTV